MQIIFSFYLQSKLFNISDFFFKILCTFDNVLKNQIFYYLLFVIIYKFYYNFWYNLCRDRPTLGQGGHSPPPQKKKNVVYIYIWVEILNFRSNPRMQFEKITHKLSSKKKKKKN